MKEWEVLSDEETTFVWNEVRVRYNFNPKYDSNKETLDFLKLPTPCCVYDMHLFKAYLKDQNIIITEQYYYVFNKCIKNVMIKCMGSDDYLYALDWHHTCFRYDPKSEDKMPRVLETDSCNIYFPEFHPDGDYYFFIAKDFSWGYFTHPWTQQLWVFGEQMIKEIKEVPSIYLTLRYFSNY